MTTINKVGICGIRSFGPHDEAVVRFDKPLTIFLGTNGSGKTTIIECLKMGATGDMPPLVDKGGAFIHDPKLSGMTETRAKIRLAFTDMAGRNIVVQRVFQLTNKAGNKQEFKTVESSVQIGDGDKKKVVSNRHGDFNNSVPELMGVSKAILENVIFVHQEDSLWPLGDPKRLKDKFDDIFAATRYTKALEFIRKYRKEQATKIRELKGELALWEERVKAVNRVKRDYNQLDEEESDLISAKQSIEREMNEIRKSSKQLSAKVMAVNKLQLLCQKAEAEKKAKQSVEIDLKDQMGDPMDDKSDEDLHQWDSNTQTRVLEVTERRAQRNRERRQLESEADVLADKVMDQIAELGKLEAEYQMHENNTKKLNHSKEEFIRQGFGSVQEPSLSDPNDVWEDRLQQLVDISDATVERVTNESRGILEESDRRANSAEVKLQSSVDKASKAKIEIRMKRSVLNSKRDEANKIVIGGGEDLDPLVALDKLRSAGKKKEELLRERTREINIGGLEKAYESRKKEVERVKVSIAELREEQKKLLMEKDTMDKIKREKSLIAEKERSVSMSLQSLQDKMLLLAEENVELGDVVRRAQQFHATLQLRVDDHRVTDNQALAGVSAAKATVDAARKESRRADKRLEAIEKKLLVKSNGRWNDLDQAKFNACLETTENLVEQEQVAKRGIEGVLKYVDVLVAQAEKGSKCPTCDRGFNDDDRTNILDYMRAKRVQLASKQKSNIDETEQELNYLRSLQAAWDSLEGARADENSCKGALQSSLAQAEVAEASRDDAHECLETSKVQLKEAESLQGVIRKIVDSQAELKQHKEQLELLQSRLMDGEDARTLDEVDGELEKAQLECDSISKEMDIKQKLRDSGLRELNILEKSHMQAREALLRAEAQAERRAVLMKDISEITSSISSLDTAMKTCLAEVDSLKLDSESRETEKTNLRRERLGMDRKARLECETVRRRIQAVVEETKAVEAFRIAGVEKKMSDLSDNLERNQSSAGQVKARIEDLKKVDDEDKEQLARIETTKRKVYDNIQYRRVVSEMRALSASITRAESEIQDIAGGRDVEGDYQIQIDECNRKDAERHATIGQLKSVSHRKQTVKTEMDKLDEEGSDQNLKKKQVEKKTFTLSYEDLEQYHRSLDQALMAFHTIKMQEINRLIRELWATTYRGKDIDNIEIVSDIDAGAETKAGSKRNYNYRVIMERNGVQLDMRGRCSAGQKVLASLVIRLALAESFCLSCGILALDEPTTNLDSQNIESLAAAMAAIINHRKEQENFQLIVITHDETFIELLGAREVTERYYRVSKNHAGLSSIHRENLSDLRF